MRWALFYSLQFYVSKKKGQVSILVNSSCSFEGSRWVLCVPLMYLSTTAAPLLMVALNHTISVSSQVIYYGENIKPKPPLMCTEVPASLKLLKSFYYK